MNGLKRFFYPSRAQPSAAVLDDSLNPATWAGTEDLIGLRRRGERMGLQQPRPARAARAGSHLSRFRGRGMDYLESRSYQPGDDVRCMDWRVTARTGQPHVKLYQEERERPVLLFTDLHPGMVFATRGVLKSVVAVQVAALLGWAAAARGDRIGALLASALGHAELQPRGGTHGVLQLIRLLVAHGDPRSALSATGGALELNASLLRLRRVAKPGSLIVLISDFQGLDDASTPLLARLRQHNDVMAIHIVDPIETTPPPSGLYGVMAGGQQAVLDTRSAPARQTYSDHFAERARRFEATMQRQAIAWLRLATDDDIAAALARHFSAPGALPQADPQALAA
ncbi:MAG: DUF58 domain-containing protein [Pseudomonadota bacterium]|nr:DUF58 domain-containing protein [Pseudomonadota bacterium]